MWTSYSWTNTKVWEKWKEDDRAVVEGALAVGLREGENREEGDESAKGG